MKTTTALLGGAASLALASITASALAQSAAEPSRSGRADVVAAGDADGAFITTGKFSEPSGEKMYKRVCAGCHMPDAKGAKGAGIYPALAGDQNLASGDYAVTVVVKGLHGMPAVGRMMTDQQVADVVNYVRTNFGNTYKDRVTAVQVKAVR